jgi:hypothetical protein
VPNLAAFLGTGKMPVPQKFNFPVGRAQDFYEQARCLFHKSSILLWGGRRIFMNRQDACSTKVQFSCGVGF